MLLAQQHEEPVLQHLRQALTSKKLAVSKIVGAVGERAGAVAAKNAGAKAAQKTLASSAVARVVGAGADAIPEEKITSTVGGENVYDLLKRKGIPSTLSDEEIAVARAVDLRMQAGKKSISGTVGKTSYGKSSRNSGADNIADAARLKEYYKQAEKYGTGSIKELQNGRFHFYEELKPARAQGEMAGARHVREWDRIQDISEIGMKLWSIMETLDRFDQILI